MVLPTVALTSTVGFHFSRKACPQQVTPLIGVWALSLPLHLVSRACEPWLVQRVNEPSQLSIPRGLRRWEIPGKKGRDELSFLYLRFQLEDTGVLWDLLPSLEIPAWLSPAHPGQDAFPHCVHCDTLHSHLMKECSSVFYRPGKRGKRRKILSLSP